MKWLFKYVSFKWWLLLLGLYPLCRFADGSYATGTVRAPIIKKNQGVGLNVTFVTWNLAQCSPSKADCAFLSQAGAGSSIFVIGLQEVEILKPRRQEGRRSRLIRNIISSNLRKEFVPISTTRLGSIQMFVFLRKSMKRHIEPASVRTWEVSCGVGNVLQNKGALGMSMNICGHRLAFISAHLAAHQSKVGARNTDFWRIMRESEKFLSENCNNVDYEQGDEESGIRAGGKSTGSNYWDRSDDEEEEEEEEECDMNSYDFPSLENFDCIIFGGDLNYRLDLSREEVQLCLEDASKGDAIASLLDHDQLTHARVSEAAFSGFLEGAINFPPTFKYDKRCDTYDTSKKRRVPAWTDRVLYRAPPGVATLLKYDAIAKSRHSDHRAVLAKFLLQSIKPEKDGE